MKKLIASLCLAIAATVSVSAQTDDEYNKNEFFVGYSNQQIDRGKRDNFNGIEGAYTRNINRYFGIKGDVSSAYRSYNLDFFFYNSTVNPTNYRSEVTDSVHNFLGGIQIKDNASKSRLKPFGHALAGVAHTRSKTKNVTCISGDCSGNSIYFPSEFTTKSTGFAAAVGGGLDIKINDRFDFRAIQADYNPVRNYGLWSHNFRFGIGLVIK